jgi:hypothetical protein
MSSRIPYSGLVFFVLLLGARAGFAEQLLDASELQISGSVMAVEGDAKTGTVTGDIAYGRYISPKWEIGARQMLGYSINDPFEDVWVGSTTAFFNYHPWAEVPGKRLQPFIGAFAGLGYSDVDFTGTIGPIFGLKYFFDSSTFFLVQYRYEYYLEELDAGDETDDFDTGNHAVSMGVGFKWGG